MVIGSNNDCVDGTFQQSDHIFVDAGGWMGMEDESRQEKRTMELKGSRSYRSSPSCRQVQAQAQAELSFHVMSR